MNESNKQTLIKFGKILLFFILVMSMIITGAGIGNYVYMTKEFFYILPMIVSIAMNIYFLIKKKDFFFK